MTLRIYGEAVLHLLRRIDSDDDRLGWTACGLRFAWGTVPRTHGNLPRCRRCWP